MSFTSMPGAARRQTPLIDAQDGYRAQNRAADHRHS
jgi:hypothetical protein